MYVILRWYNLPNPHFTSICNFTAAQLFDTRRCGLVMITLVCVDLADIVYRGNFA